MSAKEGVEGKEECHGGDIFAALGPLVPTVLLLRPIIQIIWARSLPILRRDFLPVVNHDSVAGPYRKTEHAELSSLKSFAAKEGLDLDNSLKLLEDAGLTGADPGEILNEVAAANDKTPQAIYEVIKTAKIEQDRVLSGKPSLPDHPRPGFGNKTLAEVCRELRLDQGFILAGLKKQGITAQPDLTIKVIAAGHGKEPIQLYEVLRAVVAEQ